MAKSGASKMGHDPLAWMLEGEGDVEEAGKPPATKKRSSATPARGRSRRTGKKSPAKSTRGRKGLAVEVLESSFELLAPRAEELVARFYEELFARHPEVLPLFEGVEMEDQKQKLLAALKLVVSSLRRPAQMNRALQEMGRRHQAYGVEAEHYPMVASTLLDVMAELAGEAWTEEVSSAWEEALSGVANAMLGAYETEVRQEERAMATRASAARKKSMPMGAGIVDDFEVLKEILEHSPVNVMIADSEENIVFVNRRARETLYGLEDELAKYLPGFRAEQVLGGSIHRYHKDPDAIKRILHRLQPGEVREGEITPGPFVFAHETRVLADRDGNRLGYVVQWHDVTEERIKADQAERLQRAIEGAMTAMMMIDRDLNITYVNEATRRLLQEHEEVFRSLYPGFSVEKVVGLNIDMFHKNPAYQRQLLADPSNLPYSSDIQVGPLTFRINVSAMYDRKGEYIGNAMEWADVTELRRKEREVERLKAAIDGAGTCLMLCDDKLNITYANPAVIELLDSRREQLQRIWPGFDPRQMVGQNIDQFHKNPGHQRALLTDPSRLPFKGEIQVGDLEFELNVTMVTDSGGTYLGNMIEWRDITEQKDAERQIEGLIRDAVNGNLESRIDVDSYEGFIRSFGEGINQLLDAISRPIGDTTRAMSRLAEGDLSARMDGDYHGAFGALRDAINETMAHLRKTVGKIRDASGEIASAASEIAQGNQDLSSRTESQASSLEETASSMEQLTSTVRQNADNAAQANQLAASARDQAEAGGKVVGHAIEAMGEINSASKKISDIIGVIDEIAFQTNLLALNAAVEAARAGEQGRGFAVVATEVRNLAQRSAAAAKEIKALIKDSVEKVEEGSRLVDQSGRSLEQIVNSVKKVSDIIAEIAAASQEQSSGIDQVNQAVTQMDEMTQQNAALVEEAAAAAESLDDQARELKRLIGFFSLGDLEGDAGEQPSTAVEPATAHRAKRPGPAQSRRTRPVAPPPAPAAEEVDDEWEEF